MTFLVMSVCEFIECVWETFSCCFPFPLLCTSFSSVSVISRYPPSCIWCYALSVCLSLRSQAKLMCLSFEKSTQNNINNHFRIQSNNHHFLRCICVCDMFSHTPYQSVGSLYHTHGRKCECVHHHHIPFNGRNRCVCVGVCSSLLGLKKWQIRFQSLTRRVRRWRRIDGKKWRERESKTDSFQHAFLYMNSIPWVNVMVVQLLFSLSLQTILQLLYFFHLSLSLPSLDESRVHDLLFSFFLLSVLLLFHQNPLSSPLSPSFPDHRSNSRPSDDLNYPKWFGIICCFPRWKLTFPTSHCALYTRCTALHDRERERKKERGKEV